MSELQVELALREMEEQNSLLCWQKASCQKS